MSSKNTKQSLKGTTLSDLFEKRKKNIENYFNDANERNSQDLENLESKYNSEIEDINLATFEEKLKMVSDLGNEIVKMIEKNLPKVFIDAVRSYTEYSSIQISDKNSTVNINLERAISVDFPSIRDEKTCRSDEEMINFLENEVKMMVNFFKMVEKMDDHAIELLVKKSKGNINLDKVI